MATLKNDIIKAMINIHLRKNDEYIHLSEIYSEVEKIRNKKNPNNGASIRAALEIHSIASDAFTGEELFELKEKGSGLYKYKYIDNIKYVYNMEIGTKYTMQQIMDIFKVSGQSGIMKTNKLNMLVLTSSMDNGVYGDSDLENGTIIYTGEGQSGDQQINKNNYTLYHNKELNIPMVLFLKDRSNNYIYEGFVELYDTPYQVEEVGADGKQRLVWKFPLSVVDVESDDYYNSNNHEYLVKVVEEAENNIKEIPLNKITFVEGKLNVRNYVKTEDKKHSRKRKPDYIANQIEKQKNGELSEQAIYELEYKKVLEAQLLNELKEMEDAFINKTDEEGYDILSFDIDKDGNILKKYIEVKSTKGPESTPIDITDNEIEFAKNHIDNYYIYRIYNSDKDNCSCKIVTGRELFEEFMLVPVSYKIYKPIL
jgi:5-methylcytosine-specific restriction protein A